MKKLLLLCCAVVLIHLAHAQETFPVNGPYDVRPRQYAFTNATIVVNADQTITNGVLLVKDRVIEAVGADVKVPKGYVTIDLKGKYIYPGLVDAYTSYGIPEAPRAQVRFAPDARVSDITTLLDNYHASIIEARGGMFRLQFGSDPMPRDQAAALINKLKGEKIVNLVVPTR